MGSLDRPDDAVGGVGGDAGMKREGMKATLAMIDTMRTMFGTVSKRGLINCASWLVVSLTLQIQ